MEEIFTIDVKLVKYLDIRGMDDSRKIVVTA
jgi:hypothetical protein